MKINHDSWNRLSSSNWTDERIWTFDIGDTIELSAKQFISTNYDDSVVHGGYGFTASPDQKLIIIDTSGFFTEVRTFSDSVGLVETEEIKEHISENTYFRHFKWNFIKTDKQRKERIAELKEEYQMSDGEFYDRLTEEHYKRTGLKIMGFND